MKTLSIKDVLSKLVKNSAVVYQSGTKSLVTGSLQTVYSHTFSEGTWLIIGTIKVQNNGGTANVGQVRFNKDGSLVSAIKSIPDTSLNIVNTYTLTNANNTVMGLELFQATGSTQSWLWTFTAIRIA